MTVDESTMQDIVAFHGHRCPGLAIGVVAAEMARCIAGHVLRPPARQRLTGSTSCSRHLCRE